MPFLRRVMPLLSGPWSAPLGAAILAFALYAPSIGYDLVYDDNGIIAADTRLDEPAFGLECWVASWWPKGSAAPATRPLITFSFWLQNQLHGRDPAWFHAVNVLLYALCCAAVTRLAWRWLAGEGDDSQQMTRAKNPPSHQPSSLEGEGARTLLGAWAVGLIFAVHPIHVEVAANVVGRAEIGAALFIALGLNFWLRWRGAINISRAVILGLMVLLAGFCKEHGYLLAGMYVLLEIVERRREHRPIFSNLPRRMVYVMFVVIAIAAAQRTAMKLNTEIDERAGVSQLDNPMQYASPTERLVTPFMLIGQATKLLAVPFDQSPDYSPRMLMPTRRLDRPRVLIGLAVVGLWCGLTIRAWRRRRMIAGPLLMIPVAWWIPSNTIPLIGTIFGERLLTTLSLFVAIAAAAMVPWDKLRGKNGVMTAITTAAAVAVYLWFQDGYWYPIWTQVGQVGLGVNPVTGVVVPLAVMTLLLIGWVLWAGWATRRGPAVIVVALIGLGYAAATCLYSPTWTDPVTHTTITTVITQPESGRFQGFLASALVRRALSNPQAQDELFDQAEEHAREALRLWPRQGGVYAVLGLVARHRGDEQQARAYFRKSRLAQTEMGLGDYGMFLLGDMPSPAELRQRAEVLEAHLEQHPEDVAARRELAYAWTDLKEYEKALPHYEKLITPQTEETELLDRYLDALLSTGELEKALGVYENWIAVAPDRWSVLYDAAMIAIARREKLDRARQWLERARKLSPGSSQPWAGLAQWHYVKGQIDPAVAAYRQAIRRTSPDDPARAHYQLMIDKILDRG